VLTVRVEDDSSSCWSQAGLEAFLGNRDDAVLASGVELTREAQALWLEVVWSTACSMKGPVVDANVVEIDNHLQEPAIVDMWDVREPGGICVIGCRMSGPEVVGPEPPPRRDVECIRGSLGQFSEYGLMPKVARPEHGNIVVHAPSGVGRVAALELRAEQREIEEVCRIACEAKFAPYHLPSCVERRLIHGGATALLS